MSRHLNQTRFAFICENPTPAEVLLLKNPKMSAFDVFPAFRYFVQYMAIELAHDDTYIVGIVQMKSHTSIVRLAALANRAIKVTDSGPHIPPLLRRNGNFYKFAKFARRITTPAIELDNWWLIGTTNPRKLCPGAFVKRCDKDWSGYKHQETVIIGDMCPETALNMAPLLRQWCDKYPFPAYFNGITTLIRPKRIVIISRHNIGDCFDFSYIGDLHSVFIVRRI